MKKMLSLLFLSSSLFSMQLALKMKTPRFDRVKSAVVKQQKAIALQANQVISKVVNTPKVYIDASSVRTPYNLSDVKLYHGKKGFVVLHDDEKHVIEKCFMDQTARSITREGLRSFLKTGRFEIRQANDGTFMLNAHHRLTGGGPLFGGFMYWLTKSVCYGGLAAAAGTSVVATGGAVAAVVAGPAIAGGAGTVTALAVAGNAATGAIITTAGATTVGATIVTTAGVGVGVASTGAAVATGAGIVTTALGATAVGATATNAVVATTGAVLATGASTGGIIVGIEALSTAVGTFFGMLPTP